MAILDHSISRIWSKPGKLYEMGVQINNSHFAKATANTILQATNKVILKTVHYILNVYEQSVQRAEPFDQKFNFWQRVETSLLVNDGLKLFPGDFIARDEHKILQTLASLVREVSAEEKADRYEKDQVFLPQHVMEIQLDESTKATGVDELSMETAKNLAIAEAVYMIQGSPQLKAKWEKLLKEN